MQNPKIIYGTAWKEDATKDLVVAAVGEGFRAIDTANQPWHYSEDLVGLALSDMAEIPRGALFLQTKFTPLGGHDHRIPYNANATLTDQVRESFKGSLAHLGATYLDAYLLHGPYGAGSLNASDWEVWRTLEAIHGEGGAHAIGISNVNRHQLEQLLAGAQVKPTIVQNRCYASQGWDRQVRSLCKEQGIVYQGFSLLTANPYVLRSPLVVAASQRLGKTHAQIVLRFSQQVGMVPLSGTTDRLHMRQDLELEAFDLEPEEIEALEQIDRR